MTETLTNEGMAALSQSNFQLIEYAIRLARYYIASGRECNLKEILRDVRRHPNPHYIEELREIDKIEERSNNKEEREQT